MYTLVECLAIAGIVVILGAALFLVFSVFVFAEAGVRAVARRVQWLASRKGAGPGADLAHRLWPQLPVMVMESEFEGQGDAARQIFPKSGIHGAHHADPDC